MLDLLCERLVDIKANNIYTRDEVCILLSQAISV